MARKSVSEALASTDQAEFIRAHRVMSLYSPFFFVRTVLDNPDIIDRIHGEDMETVLRVLGRKQNKVFIEYPRMWMKTSTFTTGLSVWLLLPEDDNDRQYAVETLGLSAKRWERLAKLRNRNYTQLLCFETITNAKKKLGRIRWHFESNQLFRACFPELAYQGHERPWSDESFKIRRTGTAAKEGEGTFDAAGVDVAVQSRHYDIIWLDDVVGEAARNSETEMANTISWVGRLAGVQQLGAKTWWLGVSNRWAFNDLNSVLQGDSAWHFFTRHNWLLDEDGVRVPQFPEQYPLETLDQLKHHFVNVSREGSETDFLTQFNNEPRPAGERIVTAERVHRYVVTKSGEIDCSCGGRYYPESLNRYLLFDPYNAKGKTASKSAPALAAVGLSTDRHVFLLEIFQKKVTHSALCDKIFEMNDRWREFVAMAYEDVGAQNMWEILLRKEQQSPIWQKKRHRPLRVVKPVGVSNKPLETRVREFLVPYLEDRPGVGCFSARPEQQLFWDMLETFPFPVPAHDYDLLSALAMGGHPDFHWHFPYGEDEERRATRDEEIYLEHFNQPYSQPVA